MKKNKFHITPDHNHLVGPGIWFYLAICFTVSAVPVADARHLGLEEVEALEKQCLAAEEPVYAQFRERAIAECEELEKKNRGDPESCARRHQDIQPPLKRKLPAQVNIIIDPPLPICVEAREARKHFRLYPK